MSKIGFLSLAATGVGLFFIQDRLPSQVRPAGETCCCPLLPLCRHCCPFAAPDAATAACMQVVLILMVIWVLGMRKLSMKETEEDIKKIVTEQEAERARSLGFADTNALKGPAALQLTAAAEQAAAEAAEADDEEPGKPRRRRAQRA